MKKVTRTLKRNRQPGELATPIQSIRNFCINCMGCQVNEVKKCSNPGCWAYPYRMGVRPTKATEIRLGVDLGLEG